MELGTGCSYAAKKDCAQLECGNAFSRTGLAWKSHGVYWSVCMAASLQSMRKIGCASVYGCQILQRKHIPCESLATGESTCRGFQKTVL